MSDNRPFDDNCDDSSQIDPTGYSADRRVPSHFAGAVRFLEEHARIIKLPGGGWRVWLRSADLRVYGTTRWAALNEAAKRVMGRPFNELLRSGLYRGSRRSLRIRSRDPLL